jgi:hypothetical protein
MLSVASQFARRPGVAGGCAAFRLVMGGTQLGRETTVLVLAGAGCCQSRQMKCTNGIGLSIWVNIFVPGGRS